MGHPRRQAGHAFREAPPPRRRHHRALALQVRRGQGRAGRRARLPHRRAAGVEGSRSTGPWSRSRPTSPRASCPGRRPSGTTASSSATPRRPRSSASGSARSGATCSTSTSARSSTRSGDAREEETGLEPPVPPEPLAWAPMESAEDALAPRARARRPADDPQRGRLNRHAGFHGRGRLRRAAGARRRGHERRLHRPVLAACLPLEDVVAAIQELLGRPRSGFPGGLHDRRLRRGGRRRAAAFIDKVPALLTLEAGSRWVEIDPRIAPRPGEPVLRRSCSHRRSSGRSSRVCWPPGATRWS